MNASGIGERDKDISPETERLIRAIIAKLQAKRNVLGDSLEHGSLTWDRRKKDGGFEVTLQPRI
jgi:hypothetical protein